MPPKTNAPAAKPWDTKQSKQTATPAAIAAQAPAQAPAQSEDNVVTDETPSEQPVVEEAREVEGQFVEMVIVVVPKAYKLRLDNHRVINVAAGTQRMEREHAEHWYSVANGVTVFEE